MLIFNLFIKVNIKSYELIFYKTNILEKLFHIENLI